MKQNTRIARLVRNKRVKKLANFATVALLVCPLAIGAVKALAENVEETPVTEEVAPAVVEKEQTEDLKLEDTENNDAVQEEETLPEIVPNLAKSEEEAGLKEVPEATGQQDPVKDAEIADLFNQLYNLHGDLESKASGTEFESELLDVYHEFDQISQFQGLFVQINGWDGWYNYALSNLPRILNDLKAIETKLNETIPEKMGTYTLICLAWLPGDDGQSPIYEETKTVPYGTFVREDAPEFPNFKLWLTPPGTGYEHPYVEFTMDEETDKRSVIFNYTSTATIVDNIFTADKTNVKVGEKVTFALTRNFSEGTSKDMPLGESPNGLVTVYDEATGEVVNSNSWTPDKAGTYTFRLKDNISKLDVEGVSVVITVTGENTEIDLSKLQAIYNSIGDKSQYTEESWTKFTDDSVYLKNGFWLKEAKRLLDGENVDWDNLSQEYVDKIVAGLQDAINTILVKTDNGGTASDTDTSGDNKDKGSENSTATDNGNNPSSGKQNNSNLHNSTDQKTNNAKNNSNSNQEQNKNLPTTGEKETYVMFLSGLIALGGMLVAVFKRKRKEV